MFYIIIFQFHPLLLIHLYTQMCLIVDLVPICQYPAIKHLHFRTNVKFPKHKNKKTQKHLLCVLMTETLIYVLETLVYVLETHKCFNFIHAQETLTRKHIINFALFVSKHLFFDRNNISYISNDLKFCNGCKNIESNSKKNFFTVANFLNI